MPNLDLLDNIIALVVVILLLSLIVQSLQSLFKKLLSMKSKQIEDSLIDLFDSVLRERQAAPAAGGTETRARSRATAKAGVMNMLTIFPTSPTEQVGPRAKELLNAVKREMTELGRVDFRGNFSLDSLSKADLLNVIARVAPNTIVDGFNDKLTAAMQKIREIETAIGRVKAADLPGEANALFARMQEVLAPLQQHYRSLVTPDASDPNAISVRAGLVVADILALRQVLFIDTLEILGKTQRTVAEEKAKAPDAAKPALAEVEKGLAGVAAAVNATRTALDDAFGGFKSKLTEIESWFDTVMQGFEERYQRGMKSLSIILGALVVVLLNANVFAIYKSISVNEALRKNLVDQGDEIAQLQQDIATMEEGGTVTPTATDTTATSATPSTKADTLPEKKKKLDSLVDRYTMFGFKPTTWNQFLTWAQDLVTLDANENGSWLARRGDDFRTILGWLVMTMLLSLGAPFWHDALSSLFGVKNLLQKKNEQRNVEQARGAGNPAN
jgi:hypothetical protein